jgi:hypothetical protein
MYLIFLRHKKAKKEHKFQEAKCASFGYPIVKRLRIEGDEFSYSHILSEEYCYEHKKTGCLPVCVSVCLLVDIC